MPKPTRPIKIVLGVLAALTLLAAALIANMDSGIVTGHAVRDDRESLLLSTKGTRAISRTSADASGRDLLAGTPAKQLMPGAPLQRDRRLIIRAAVLRMRVGKLKSQEEQVRAIVRKAGGYVSRQQFQGQKVAQLTIRIPSREFDSTLQVVEKVGVYTARKTVEAKDVSEEYADLELRLLSKRAAVQQYLRIMSRARAVKDVLAVQAELRKIREEIERFEGRTRFLKSRVAFSTIELTLYVDQWGAVHDRSFFRRAGQALVGGWSGLTATLLFLLHLWPLLLAALSTWPVYRWFRKRKINGTA